VAALKVGRKALARNYDDMTRALLSMAANLSDRPAPDAVHDLRVAARRIQVTRRLTPRRVRSSQDSKRLDLALRTVMKATSQLRDTDTLMDTLKSHTGSLPDGLLVNLGNQRSDIAVRARMAIVALAEVPAPKLDASELRGKRLSKRLRKGFRRHSKKASFLLTRVLRDESKVVELHSLRKEVKKVRYLSELADKPPQRLSSLAKWQDSLGAIHDIDVAIAYLKGLGADFGRAILELQRDRHSKYMAFVRDFRTAQVQALREEGALSLGALAPTDLSPA